MRVTVQVHPRAAKAHIIEKEQGILHVFLASPPVDGEANHELVDLLSDYFEVAKSAIEIIKGYTARTKIIEIRPWQKR